MRGPYMTVTENMVGPNNSYTMFRPQTLGQAGLKHPVITWGNGTGTMPSTYRTMLTHYASHGFVVIASNSENVGQGTPPPMLDGVSWVLAQNGAQGNPLYDCIDAAKIGATGHSQGAFATVSAGADPRIATIAPLQGSGSGRNLHGPAAFFCGGMDTTLPCSGHMSAFNSVTQYPVMLANQLAATHTNWMGFGSTSLNPYVVATTGWFRVHLMGDTAIRNMFYGADCTLCQDTATWQIQRKMMD
jgi:predicted dienelactone hydrolase